jgi:hypothetical protein
MRRNWENRWQSDWDFNPKFPCSSRKIRDRLYYSVIISEKYNQNKASPIKRTLSNLILILGFF